MAIITPAQAREMLPALSGTGEDTLLATLISAADAAIADHLGYVGGTIEDTSTTLYSGDPGGVLVCGRELWLPTDQIASVTSVYDDPNEVYGADTLVASTDYVIAGGRIRLLPASTHGAWSEGARAVKVTAVIGYATIPTAIAHAARIVVRQMWEQRAAGFATSSQMGDATRTPQQVVIPAEAAELLAPYRISLRWVA